MSKKKKQKSPQPKPIALKNICGQPFQEYLRGRKPGNSRFIPQVKGWEEDLPEQSVEHSAPPQLILVNEVNDIWLEIPRYENIMWGGLWFLFFLVSFGIVRFLFPLYLFASSKLEFILTSFPLISCVIYILRMVLFVPRGTAVRFNRKRQKIYVYEHQRSNWNPWSRWPTVVKIFDWADIHAERIFKAGRGDYGHQLSCVVCKPGTYEVVNRFILTWTVNDINMIRGLWSYCCQYMQGNTLSPHPLWTERPLTWCPWSNIRWPEDIDRESRTAPNSV